MDYSTYENAIELFRQVNCVGEQENCIFGAFKDVSKGASLYTGVIGNTFGGVIGGVVGDLIGENIEVRQNKLNKYTWYLINQTENGLGIMPLVVSGGIVMNFNPQKLSPVFEDFTFYSYQELKNIEVKNLGGLNKKVQAVTIVFANGTKLNLTVSIKEKLLIYQESNFTRFMARYKH